MKAPATSSLANALRTEWLLSVGVASTALFFLFGKAWLADLSNAAWTFLLFLWLFGAILICAFGVVRHADCLAIKLGEPFGTLILTLAVVGMEVMMVAAHSDDLRSAASNGLRTAHVARPQESPTGEAGPKGSVDFAARDFTDLADKIA